jgi:hypothetical protein
VVVTATVRTAAHGHNPPGLRHLIVDLPEGGRHLVGERAGHNDDVSLTRRRAKYDPVPA